MRGFKVPLVAALVLGAAAGCEWVLGDLPPVKQNTDGGGSGGSPSGSTSTTTGTTATTSSTKGTGGTGCCDCDGDNYKSKALCGADDCDDHDPLVHPGQTMYFPTPSQNPAVGWDYNCNGMPDPEFPTPVNCALLTIATCDAGVGFLGTTVPSCGKTGPWGSCVPEMLQLICTQQVIDPAKVQECH